MALLPAFPSLPLHSFLRKHQPLHCIPVYIYGMLTSVVYGSIYSKEAAVFEKRSGGGTKRKAGIRTID